jgi:DNA-binding NarL/FixJ family response regulator
LLVPLDRSILRSLGMDGGPVHGTIDRRGSVGRSDGDRATASFVVIDDDPAIRRVVALQSRRTPEVTLLGEAADGAEGIGVVATLQPQVILLDLLMPTPGLTVLPALMQVSPRSAILAWSADEDALERACASGADDGIAKIRSWNEVAARMAELAGAVDRVGCESTALPRHSRLRLEDLRVVAARPFAAPVSEATTWPCPGCSDRRPLVGACQLDVTDHGSASLPHKVLICAVCAESFGVGPLPAQD